MEVMMGKNERIQKILAILDEKNVVMVNELQQLCNVTEMTVRRDLTYLEKEHKAVRIHGGAKKIIHETFEQLPHQERIHHHFEQKDLIAKKAASLIHQHDILFIGASTTNELIQQHLSATEITVVTNCRYIFDQYANDDRYEVLLIGGKYNRKTESFLGNITLQQAAMMNYHKALIGTNGIYKKNLCASNDEEATLHKTILEHSHEKYILCDSEKFGKNAFYSFFPCEDITAIITDDGPILDRQELETITQIL